MEHNINQTHILAFVTKQWLNYTSDLNITGNYDTKNYDIFAKVEHT